MSACCFVCALRRAGRCLRQASGLCFVEQLEPVTAGAIVYDAGLCTEGRKLLKRHRATIKTLSLRLLLDPVQFLLMERQNLNLPQEKPSFFSNIFSFALKFQSESPL